MRKVWIGLLFTAVLAMLGFGISVGGDKDFGWYFKFGAVISGMTTLTRLQDELWKKD